MNYSGGPGTGRTLKILAAIMCLAGIIFLVFPSKERQQLPQDIFGEWFSGDPRYQSCFLNITADSFVIGGADGNIYHYGLKSVAGEKAVNSEGYFYTLLCTDPEGLELEFRLYYDPAAGVLSYKNQRNVIWFKAKQKK